MYLLTALVGDSSLSNEKKTMKNKLPRGLGQRAHVALCILLCFAVSLMAACSEGRDSELSASEQMGRDQPGKDNEDWMPSTKLKDDPEPEEINSNYLPQGHPLKAYLREFEQQTDFVDDHCIRDACFARLFDLPKMVELRRQDQPRMHLH